MRIMVTTVLDCSQHPEEELQPNLHEEVMTMIAVLTNIC